MNALNVSCYFIVLSIKNAFICEIKAIWAKQGPNAQKKQHFQKYLCTCRRSLWPDIQCQTFILAVFILMIVTFTCVVFIYFQLSSVYLFIFVTSLYLLLLFKTALKIKFLQYGCFLTTFYDSGTVGFGTVIWLHTLFHLLEL